jgi:2-methylisocitrate lyase-like PEP mutase family enzyme
LARPTRFAILILEQGDQVMADTAQKRAAFRKLHEEGCFVMPNAWDAGSARILESVGFKAVASTSAGFAWTLGRQDNHVTLDDVLGHLKLMCERTSLPVNADFENGFAREPEAVAANAVLAAQAGVAGVSIEDLTGEADGGLYDEALTVERIRACRMALDAEAPDVMLVGRSEGVLHGQLNLQQATDRMVAIAEAGADVIFLPGLRQPDDIAALVRAVAPKPVSVLIGGPHLNLEQVAELGVRRVSVGGSLARIAYSALVTAANHIANKGDFAPLIEGVPRKQINDLFAD